jgi:hypothetical protein
MGFAVEYVPEGSERRADLFVKDEVSSYVIEVKQRLDDPAMLTKHSERLDRGEIVTRAAPCAYSNRTSAILTQAAKQLDSTPTPTGTFRLIWLQLDGLDHDLRWKQAFATFYGSVYLFPKKNRQSNTPQCFYFDYSAAFSMPNVDGLVLSDVEGIHLCVNEFSRTVEEFTESRLFHGFAQSNALTDPRKMKMRTDVVVLRSDVSRKDDRQILDALMVQTGIEYDVIRFSQHSASARIDDSSAS